MVKLCFSFPLQCQVNTHWYFWIFFFPQHSLIIQEGGNTHTHARTAVKDDQIWSQEHYHYKTGMVYFQWKHRHQPLKIYIYMYIWFCFFYIFTQTVNNLTRHLAKKKKNQIKEKTGYLFVCDSTTQHHWIKLKFWMAILK